MKVWIVLKNGKIDEVFDNEDAAIHHKKQLIRKWSLTDIVEKEVLSL